MGEKGEIIVCTIGHAGSGKSTIGGRMIYNLGYIPNKIFQNIIEASESIGRGSYKYAWLFDKLKWEREIGKSIDITTTRIETNNRFIHLVDTPGTPKFIRNFINGISNANAAIVVLAANYEIREFEQLKDYLTIAYAYGVKQFIFCVNKMDLVFFSQESFVNIVSIFTKFFTQKLKIDIKNVRFIPTSGFHNDNIMDISMKTPWYNGRSLFQSLNELEVPKISKELIDKPFRMAIQSCYSLVTRVRAISIVGTVLSGSIKLGDEILISPMNRTFVVTSMAKYDDLITEAKAGEKISLAFREMKRVEYFRLTSGMMLSHVYDPSSIVHRIKARIILINHPSQIKEGYSPVMYVNSFKVGCKIIKFISRNGADGSIIEENPKVLVSNEGTVRTIAIVEIEMLKDAFLESYKENPCLGRFVLREARTVAVGVVLEINQLKYKMDGSFTKSALK